MRNRPAIEVRESAIPTGSVDPGAVVGSRELDEPHDQQEARVGEMLLEALRRGVVCVRCAVHDFCELELVLESRRCVLTQLAADDEQSLAPKYGANQSFDRCVHSWSSHGWRPLSLVAERSGRLGATLGECGCQLAAKSRQGWNAVSSLRASVSPLDLLGARQFLLARALREVAIGLDSQPKQMGLPPPPERRNHRTTR